MSEPAIERTIKKNVISRPDLVKKDSSHIPSIRNFISSMYVMIVLGRPVQSLIFTFSTFSLNISATQDKINQILLFYFTRKSGEKRCFVRALMQKKMQTSGLEYEVATYIPVYAVIICFNHKRMPENVGNRPIDIQYN